MFISNTKISIARVSSSIQVVLGGFLAFIWSVGLSVIFDDPIQRTLHSSDLSLIAVDVIMLALSLLLLLLGIKKKILISNAKKLSNIFEGDKDGVVNVKEISSLMGMPEDKFMKFFDVLVKRGYIKNASLNNENGLCILLTREGDADPEIEYLKCPDCGATTSVRKGYSGKCQYCGSPLKKD